MPFYNGLPLIGPHLKSNSRLDIFSVAEEKKLQAEYRDALGIGKDATFSAEAFGVLAKTSMRDFHGFKDTKGLGDLNIHDKLVGASLTDDGDIENAKIARDGINDALKPTDAFTKAQTEFEASVATFKRLADKVPDTYKAQDLIGLMNEIKSDAVKAIKAQHTHEKEALLEKFKEPEFADALYKTLKLTSPADVKAVQDNMIKDLESSQADKLQAFEKSTAESVNSLHKAAAAQMSELLFIANLYKNNKDERQKIIDLASQRRKAANLPEPQTAVISAKEDAMTISGITIASLKDMTSFTGKTIKQEKPGVFTLEMNNKWFLDFDPAYYQDPRQNPKADMLFMAKAVKASGFEKIIVRLDFDKDKPEVVSERAKQAYEAAIEAGFPRSKGGDDKTPNKIAIIVNGVEMKPEDIFKEDPERLRAIHARADQIEKETSELLEGIKPQGTAVNAAMKEEMTQLKAEDKLKQEAAKEADLDESDEASLSTGPTL